MQKIDFINNQQPALNATNLNKLQQNVEDVTGDLSELETSAKNNLVEAINEAASTGSGGDTLPIYSIVDYDGDTVPSGYEEVNSYSTTEVKTGDTWIDGKPIYRKVITIPSFKNAIINVNTGITNAETIFIKSGTWERPDVPNKIYSLDNTFMGQYEFNRQDGILNISTNNQYVTFSGYIVLEYTKTTDGGNS